MTATVTCFAGPCINDAGIRTNFVGVLGFNRYTVLPFVFTDVNATLAGTVVVADFRIGASNFIYLYGYGVGMQSALGGGFFLSSAITQTYQTLGGIGTFGASISGPATPPGPGGRRGDHDAVTSTASRSAVAGAIRAALRSPRRMGRSSGGRRPDQPDRDRCHAVQRDRARRGPDHAALGR